MFRMHWEQGRKTKTYLPRTSPPKGKNRGNRRLHVDVSYWLHETFIFKTVCHHFWPGLMAWAEFWGHVYLWVLFNL